MGSAGRRLQRFFSLLDDRCGPIFMRVDTRSCSTQYLPLPPASDAITTRFWIWRPSFERQRDFNPNNTLLRTHFRFADHPAGWLYCTGSSIASRRSGVDSTLSRCG